MNRRSFIKLSMITGIGAMVPVEFLIDHRDPETKFMQHIMENYSEVEVIAIIKTYGYTTSGGAIMSFFKEWAERQPVVVDWLRNMLGPNAPDNPGRDAYYKQKSSGILTAKMSIWSADEYDKLAQRFNLKRNSRLADVKRWNEEALKEFTSRAT